ncbi:MAG: helix-turn-helix domain-containing protein, partial [Verrucomicrobiaceae bacterium]
PDEVLRHLLESNGMTGAAFARFLGVSTSMVSLLLSGKRQLTPAHMAILSEQFKISPAVFVPACGLKTRTQ